MKTPINATFLNLCKVNVTNVVNDLQKFYLLSIIITLNTFILKFLKKMSEKGNMCVE